MEKTHKTNSKAIKPTKGSRRWTENCY